MAENQKNNNTHTCPPEVVTRSYKKSVYCLKPTLPLLSGKIYIAIFQKFFPRFGATGNRNF